MPWVQYGGEDVDEAWVSDDEALRLAPDRERDIPPTVKQVHSNEKAVVKVFDALSRAGLSGPQIVAVFNEIEQAGVIFRERN